jgi:hypothetical protein
MTKHAPPVPPGNRSPKDPAPPQAPPAEHGGGKKPPPANAAEQGRQGNISQNTHNQGYQQDR